MTARKIFDLRKNYTHGSLDEKFIDSNPFSLFATWFEDAVQSQILEPNAMILGTVNAEGIPNQRTVLLKEFTEQSFEFYTNYKSRKAQEIEIKPCVSLLFLWLPLQRQVIIGGIAEKVSREKSETYFAERPEDSCISAWASKQSDEIENKDVLCERATCYKNKFKGQTIPCPEFWGGYAVFPTRFEFWQGGENRLHDRIVYEKKQGIWHLKRLSP